MVLQVPASLVSLLRRLDDVAEVVADGASPPPHDYQCPLLSLPSAFATRLDTVPALAHYLSADPRKVAQWQVGPAHRLRIGLVWAGGYRPGQPEQWGVNNRRNLPLEALAVLRGVDADFISLQKGEPAQSDLARVAAQGWDGPAIADVSDRLNDFDDTAALMETLDLVISVDTAAAHLAGALGRPVWLLNRQDTDWRWLLGRDDSPWYPSLRQFRQEAPNDWDGVMRRVAAALADMTR